jgi:putative ATP-dependent endonuclease of OLD family
LRLGTKCVVQRQHDDSAEPAAEPPEYSKNASVSTAPAPSTSSKGGIFVKEVRVRNYRCLRSVDVTLDDLTLLIGPNNSGKTSFLSALFAAIGAGQRSLTSEDVFIGKGEASAPKARGVAIDVLIRPTGTNGKIVDVFPQGSAWLELWGLGVVQDDSEHDLVVIRTSFKWNAVKGEYVLERRFLKEWQSDSTKWENSKPVEKIPPVTSAQLEPLALYLLDASRDIADDVRSRGSFWAKLVNDHGLSDIDVARIEGNLTEINEDIVKSSQVFSHLQDHLREVHNTLSCEKDSIAITPLTRHLRDLSRGMDVILSTSGAPPFPMQQQGQGTRSLGTFFTFWAFTTWRQKQSGSGEVHPMMALEEPETHLHPQAQRALFRQIANMPGQRIVSTHSPYICSQCEVTRMRHFGKTGEDARVSLLSRGSGPSDLTDEDLRKINRQVMNTRGDILFAHAMILFEGDTEEQAIPDFAMRYWGKHPHDLGFSFVGVGGHGGYLPFLRLAHAFRIPWFLFSDGEADAIKSVNSALAAIGEKDAAANPRVRVLANGQDFESCIVTASNRAALTEAVIKHEAVNEKHLEALKKKWALMSDDDADKTLLATLYANKTQYGSIVGKVLPIPTELATLLGAIQPPVAAKNGGQA